MPVEPPSAEAIGRAASLLRAGELVVFPTETVYGLGAMAHDAKAVRAVFERKGRPASNPLIVHVADEAMAMTVAADWPAEASKLAEAFWPGPLTLVLPARADLPSEVTAGGPTVAVRCPDHAVALELLRAVGGPLVAPSANPSGYVSPTLAAHAAGHFSDLMVLDGGACRVGIESTVLRLDPLEILRPGAIGPEQIEAVLGRRPTFAERSAKGSEASPGRLGPHYQPKARAVMVEGPVALAALLGHAETGPCVVLAQRAVNIKPPHQLIEMPTVAAEYAARLYAALRAADAMEPELIVVLQPDGSDDAGLWSAIAERLSRATGR